MAEAEFDEVPTQDPETPTPFTGSGSLTPRPVLLDAMFGLTVAVAFALSLMRTPLTAGVAAVVFLVGSVAYAILRIRWRSRSSRPAPTQPRTTDGLLYLGLFLIAFLMSGMDVQDPLWRIAYAVGTGLVIGGTAFVLLRREEARATRQAGRR